MYGGQDGACYVHAGCSPATEFAHGYNLRGVRSELELCAQQRCKNARSANLCRAWKHRRVSYRARLSVFAPLYTGRYPSQALALDYCSPQEASFLLCHGPDNIVDDTGPTRTGTRNSGSVEPYEGVFQASVTGRVGQAWSLTSMMTQNLAFFSRATEVQKRSGCVFFIATGRSSFCNF